MAARIECAEQEHAGALRRACRMHSCFAQWQSVTKGKERKQMNTAYIDLKSFKKSGRLSEADEEGLRQAAAFLQAGGLVAFPTETVYGLGGNALLKEASKRIYAAKGRPSDNPLIVHIAELSEIEPLVSRLPQKARILAERFWPGPLTMVLPKAECMPYETTGGLDTVAIRMPEHPVTRELIRLSGLPVAAPSANLSGRPSPTTAAHCVCDLDGKIEAIVDGGSCSIGVESTIVDLSEEEPVLLRPGAVTLEMLQEALSGSVSLDPTLERPAESGSGLRPKAPGMKYRHYAPKAPMVIVQPAPDAKETDTAGAEGLETALSRVVPAARSLLKEHLEKGERVGVICSDETFPYYLPEGQELPAEKRFSDGRIWLASLGARADAGSIARNLFALLREMDDDQVDLIIAEGFDQHALGYAIMNRMKKAAGQRLIYV